MWLITEETKDLAKEFNSKVTRELPNHEAYIHMRPDGIVKLDGSFTASDLNVLVNIMSVGR